MGILKDWLRGVPCTVLCGTDETEVNDVIFDSRKAAPDTVFLCMQGSRTDSHAFLPDAYRAGCRSFIVEKPLSELPLEGIGTEDLNMILVDNARRALSYLSAARFDHPAEKMCMIGLTGTKGKTSTSYMTRTLLEKNGWKVGVIGTNGCVIGDRHYETRNTTPDSYELNARFAEMAEAGCTHVVMECSSQGFKMNRTDGIVFDYGIFLNLSPDHIGPLEHADFDEYLYCKSRLLTQSREVIVNRDDPHTRAVLEAAGLFGNRLSEDSRNAEPGKAVFDFSMEDPKADLYAFDLRYKYGADFTGTDFMVQGAVNGCVRLSIPGRFNVDNALAVILLGARLRIPLETIRAALQDIHVDGRMEAVYRSDRFTVIVDYAHNEVSMVNLLDTLKAYEPKRLVVVFGCGGNRSKDRRTGMGAAAAQAADFCVFTSDNSRYEKPEDIIADIEAAYLAAGGDREHYVRVPDRREAIRYAMEHAKDGDIVAVIGKGHEDYQEENGVRRHFLDKEEILKIRDELHL